MKRDSHLGRQLCWALLGLCLALALSVGGGYQRISAGAWIAPSVASELPARDVNRLLAQSREAFVKGQLPTAETNLLTALSATQSSQNTLAEVMVQSNLALVYGQMGRWAEANSAISESLRLLDLPGKDSDDWQRLRAQTYNVTARLQLAQGESEAAYETWRTAAQEYELAGDRAGYFKSRLRQARALQAMGFYRRAVEEVLAPLRNELATEPASAVQAKGLRDLAEALTVAANLDEARAVAIAGLEVAQTLQMPAEITAAYLTLGNIEYAQAKELLSQNDFDIDDDINAQVDQALSWYEQAATAEAVAANQVRSQLNVLALLIDFERFEDAVDRWPTTYATLIEAATADQAGIYLQVNLANSLERLAEQQLAGAPDWAQILTLLESAQNQAIALQDARAQAHVFGFMGKAYQLKGAQENTPGDLATAQKLTADAVFTAETVNAVDMSYLWYEQLGDIYLALEDAGQGINNKEAAIAAYRGAVNTLKSLRSDLVTINPEVQFSFQQSVEPLHRKLVSLLLESQEPSQANLKAARDVLESLQLEELNNYLKAACLNSQEVSVDEISGNQRIAVIYPIVLPDRVAIITNLPPATATAALKSDTAASEAGELKYYTSELQPGELEKYAATMLRQLVFVDYDVLDTAESIYHLLFPDGLIDDLAQSSPDTLVFIPDGPIRSLPIAALFDGESYLIEKYSIAITPGLQLLNPQPLQDQSLTALTFGLTEAVAEWSPLPNVAQEIKAIQEQIPIEAYLNNEFTYERFQETLQNSSVPIVHLATHGKFSSQLDETFLQAYNDRISVNDLSQWLQSDRTAPLELLVLSACETATGDQRAALGLAGMAIRAGARSTVASLWQVDDVATSVFMTRFYQELSAQAGNKAEALQIAQKHLIEDFPGDFDHPYYWAPFVLIGNWL